MSAAGDRLQDTARKAALALPDVSHGRPFTLADIARGDPFDDLFAVLDALHAVTPSRSRGPRCEPEERPVRADMIKAKLIHVLEAH